MRNSIKYVASSFIWSSLAKILNAVLKFISIPLLLNYFGKENYGLIALAVSTNAYMHLLDMGMNTGAIKFFSQWIEARNYEKIDRVARTNLTFYLVLGLVNAIVLLFLALKGDSVFNITFYEFSTFRSLLFILAGVSIFNWSSFVFNQLLVADEKISFTQQILSFRSIFNLIIVLLTILFKWSIIQYFLFDSIIGMLVIVPYYLKSKKRKLIRSIVPGFFWNDFSVVYRYSLAIFAMSIFQFTATHSRPLILGIFSNQGASILADYRVIEVFPIFIISIGGMLISILLPKTSQAIQRNDRSAIAKMAYEGTKYTSILVALLCFPIILNAKDLLSLYVGENYTHLSIWLSIWVFTLTLFLHNSPVASLVLATGKTRMLVFSSAIACTVSIIINSILTQVLGVGSAVIGYLIYIIIQMSFYYFYFNSKVLNLNSKKIFKSFIVPTSLGLFSLSVVYFIEFEFSIIINVFIKAVVWAILYIVLLDKFKILNIKSLIKRILASRKHIQ